MVLFVLHDVKHEATLKKDNFQQVWSPRIIHLEVESNMQGHKRGSIIIMVFFIGW